MELYNFGQGLSFLIKLIMEDLIMKKLLLAGLLVVSAAAFGNTVTGNEEVSADIDFTLRVRQPMALTIDNGSVDFGLLARGDMSTVNADRGTDRASGSIEGELGSTVVVEFDSRIEDNNVVLVPSLATNGTYIATGETFVLDNSLEADFGKVDLGFGATVAVKETSRSGDINHSVTYTFRYQ